MTQASPLADLIRSGTAPRNLKEYAAQGVLPMPEEDLISIQVYLSTDADPSIATASRQSLQKVNEDTWSRIVEKKDPDISLIHFCLSLKNLSFSVKEKILLNHSIPDDIVVQMATQDTGHVLDLILNNHVRLLRDPRILSSLENNRTLNLDQQRRLEEFRTEFITKVKAAEEAALPPPDIDMDLLSASVEDILAQIPDLDAEGQKILRDADLLSQEIPSDEVVQQQLRSILGDEADKLPPEMISTYQRILKMKQGEKIRVALLGNKEERGLLIRDTSKMVGSMVLKSPKLTDSEVEGFAQMRNLDSDLLRQMGQRKEFIKKYSVIHSLVKNPKTPVAISINLLKLLRATDLKNLERDKNIPELLRRQAKKSREAKETKKEH